MAFGYIVVAVVAAAVVIFSFQNGTPAERDRALLTRAQPPGAR